jgi:hypothetical protein
VLPDDVLRDVSDTCHIMEIWYLWIGEGGARVLEYTFTRRQQKCQVRPGPTAVVK